MRHRTVTATMLRVWIAGCLAALPLAGCGGDDYERTDVTGSVLVDGMPLAYGLILFEGTPDKSNRSPKCTLRIADGNFSGRADYGPGPGENKVQITVFKGSPPLEGQEGAEPKMVGTWYGTATVEPGTPLKFEFSSKDVDREG